MAVPESKRLSAEELAALNERFEQAEPQEVLAWVNERFGGSAVQMSSFGLEDVALFDMFWRVNPQARLATLDTWRLPTETYTVMDRTRLRYKARIEVHQPDSDAVARMVADQGLNLFYRGRENRIACCHVRKVEPLERALASIDAWITGLRREQGMERGSIAIVEWDKPHANYKVNPLANWSFVQVRRYVDEHAVPYNELHDQGYPSIGCAPCTRAIGPGEDPRAGRWWWESDPNAKECGLHIVAPAARSMSINLEPVSRQDPMISQTLGSHLRPESKHLRDLESESLHIIREVVAEFDRPCLLFSGGKDSAVLLHLAVKALRPAQLPFPVVHIDTGHNFPEVLAFRDRVVERLGVDLVVGSVADAIATGRIASPTGGNGSRNRLQTPVLLETIRQGGFTAVFGGARRDEERARAKERIYSLRNEFGQWDPRTQRPEVWNLYNGCIDIGQHMRVFPLSNWTELDIWRYIAEEDIELPELYYAHRREVFERDGMLMALSPVMQPAPGEAVVTRSVRFRTVGDMTSTAAVASEARTPEEVIVETLATRISERGATRADDRTTDAAMEDRKREGYF